MKNTLPSILRQDARAVFVKSCDPAAGQIPQEPRASEVIEGVPVAGTKQARSSPAQFRGAFGPKTVKKSRTVIEKKLPSVRGNT
jgi:hypothetical protein